MHHPIHDIPSQTNIYKQPNKAGRYAKCGDGMMFDLVQAGNVSRYLHVISSGTLEFGLVTTDQFILDMHDHVPANNSDQCGNKNEIAFSGGRPLIGGETSRLSKYATIE